ncbi:Sua5/YciO/YrdC/YwlC family protein, partial [Escherichia sp. TWPC-MK]
SGYALGCKIEDKNAMERICRIRQLPDGHNFTLMCRDLSELSTYSFVDNVAFRLMKNNHPAFTHDLHRLVDQTLLWV